MLSTKKLISNLNFQPKEIMLKKEDEFDFNKKESLPFNKRRNNFLWRKRLHTIIK